VFVTWKVTVFPDVPADAVAFAKRGDTDALPGIEYGSALSDRSARASGADSCGPLEDGPQAMRARATVRAGMAVWGRMGSDLVAWGTGDVQEAQS
jgi:hypothetical protein